MARSLVSFFSSKENNRKGNATDNSFINKITLNDLTNINYTNRLEQKLLCYLDSLHGIDTEHITFTTKAANKYDNKNSSNKKKNATKELTPTEINNKTLKYNKDSNSFDINEIDSTLLNEIKKKCNCDHNVLPNRIYKRKRNLKHDPSKENKTEIAKVNLLLRALSTWRSAFYILEKIKILNENEKAESCINPKKALRRTYIELKNKLQNNDYKKIKTLEGQFNRTILEIFSLINKPNKLYVGPNGSEEEKKFLEMLRFLSNTLNDAAGVWSIMERDEQKNEEKHNKSSTIDFIDLPITQKTPEQKDYIKSLKENNSADTHNFDQFLLGCFKKELLNKDTQLPAQARKFFLPTVKNGFDSFVVVHDQCDFHTTRSGTLAGNGEQKEVEKQTKWNIDQIKQYFHNSTINNLNSIILNNPFYVPGSSSQNIENDLVKTLKSIAKKKVNLYNAINIPVNPPSVLLARNKYTQLEWAAWLPIPFLTFLLLSIVGGLMLFTKPLTITITAVTLGFIGLALSLLVISWLRNKQRWTPLITTVFYATLCVGSIMFLKSDMASSIISDDAYIKDINLPQKILPIAVTSVVMAVIGIAIVVLLSSWYRRTRGAVYHKAAEKLLYYIDRKAMIHLQCASGQDRTSTVLILTYIKHLEKKLKRTTKKFNEKEYIQWIKNLEKDIVNLRHFQFITTLTAPGSEGLKRKSQSNHTFLNKYGSNLYDPMATTNKGAPIEAYTLYDIARDDDDKNQSNKRL